ncbi:MAG: NADH-ubiquinone oxidoreductase-F iron-sulfur binding region domain-containing protein [Candidatus Dormiibacterota bacterium]
MSGLSRSLETASPPASAGMEGALRLLAGPDGTDPEGLAEHLDRLGALPAALPALLGEVRAAGLRGRGGAGFPTADKIAAVIAQGGRPRAVVVANGVESEPASAKDQSLLSRRPHLVLDGLHLAGGLVGAERLLLALPRRGPAAGAVREAVRERRAHLSSEMEVELVVTPGGFVAGQETSLTSWASGGVAKPRPVPPRPSQRGVAGRPTLVQNVETLANLALIARFGALWFRSIGPEADPGTTLVTISGAVSQPGVYEVSVGTPLRDLLEGARWDGRAQAVLIGGYFGTWVPSRSATEVGYCRADLATIGAAPGAGVVAVLSPDHCGVREGAKLVRWLAGQSSHQCGPCVMGLPAIAGALEQLAAPTSAASSLLAERVLKWCDDVQGRGACHHPDGAVRLARSVLETFADELSSHREGRCLQA